MWWWLHRDGGPEEVHPSTALWGDQAAGGEARVDLRWDRDGQAQLQGGPQELLVGLHMQLLS